MFRKNEVPIPSILGILRLLPTRHKTKNSVEKVENQFNNIKDNGNTRLTTVIFCDQHVILINTQV
jgi:hypothetical protein